MADFTWERRVQTEAICYIAGVDEAGRGPLAGSVVAAAVILPLDFDVLGVNDSKTLTHIQRESLYTQIIAHALAYSIAEASPAEIDKINILRATHLAMRRAVAGLAISPDAVLVDGRPVPNLHTNCHSIIKGDSISLSIAAASILAKVTRDKQMVEAATLYPQYGFERHKGYGAEEHLAALRQHGPCPLHRRSFAPLSQMVLNFEEVGESTNAIASG
jgi:ribonuclease HII